MTELGLLFLGVTASMIHMTDNTGQNVVGERIRDARLNKGWTTQRAAREAQVSPITWRNAEQGKGLQDASLRKIELALGWVTSDGPVNRPAPNGRIHDLGTLLDGIALQVERARSLVLQMEGS